MLAAIALAACASRFERDADAARQSWNGATYPEVTSRWGAPARSDRTHGDERHTWISQAEASVRPGPSIGIFGGSVGGGGGGVFGGATVPIGGGTAEPGPRCERTLVFLNGRVVDQSWVGAADYCATFRR